MINIEAKLRDALTMQLNREFESAYMYFGMSVYADYRSLNGIQSWMTTQAKEEVGHGMKIYRYLADRGEAVKLSAIAEPKVTYPSLQAVFEEALAKEQSFFKNFEEMAGTALKIGDHTTYSFLRWFLDEQVEEVSMIEDIIGRLALSSDNPMALLILDKELGTRVDEE